MVWNVSRLIRRRFVNPTRQRPFRKSIGPAVELLEDRITPANVDILSGHYDTLLTAQNLQETTLTPANVNATNFGTLFSVPIDGQAYAQPLYKSNLSIPAMGTHNVAFIATEHDSIYAFDADTGAQLWHNSYINGTTITTIPFAELSTPDLFPEIGITGTGVIDASTSTLYEVVKTKEVGRGDGLVHYVQKLHALDLASGTEKFGGPYTIGDTHVASAGAVPGFANETTAIVVAGTGSESSGGATPLVPFSAEKENVRMSMELQGNIVYVAFASHADFRPYHGWVIGFDRTTLQPIKVFNTAPNADGVAIWESGGGLSFDSQGFMYFATGNGFQLTGGFSAFDPAHGNYSESVVKVDTNGPNWDPAHPQNTMAVADYFTPFNWQTLDSQDADLGSGGVMLLPDSVGSAAHRHLMVETGKQGRIYLIDRDTGHMGEFTAGGPDNVVQTVTAGQTGVWGNPAFYQTGPNSGIIYYHGSNSVLKGYRITNGHIDDVTTPPPSHILQSTFNSIFPGTQPSVSANGTVDPLNPTDGIVWELQVDNAVGRIQGASDNQTAGPATLRAFIANPTGTTLTELYDSAQTGQRDLTTGSVKFTVPVVTNGHVLVAGADHFAVVGLFPNQTSAPAAPSGLSVALQQTSQGPQFVLNWTNPPSNPGSDPTGIQIFRSTDGTTFTLYNTVYRTLHTFTDTGPLQVGQTYYYQVKATNQVGTSGPSNTVNILVPIPPSVLTVAGAASSSISLSWTPVTNDHYVVQRSTSGGAPFTAIATVPGFVTSYTDTGLTPGLYTYRIDAFSGMSPPSQSNLEGAWVGATIDHSTPPTGGFGNTTDMTTNGSAFFVTNLLRLTNSGPPTDPPQAGSAFSNTRMAVAGFTTSFSVRLHEGSQPSYADGFTFVLQANSPTALGQASGGIGYQGIGNSVAIKFDTYNNEGEQNPDQTMTGGSTGLFYGGDLPTIPHAAFPGEVNIELNRNQVNLLSQSTKVITLTYTYNASNPAASVLHETILDPDHGTTPEFSHDYTVNIPALLGTDTAYVGLTGASGSGGFFELEDVQSWQFSSQATLPGAPTNLRVAASASSEIDLAWNANSFNETGYQVERSTDGASFTQIATTTLPAYRDFGLNSGTYFYRVRAVNGAGNSPYSNVLQTSVPAPILSVHQDIGTAGNPSPAGNATFSNGVYTVTGSGSDIWDTADHFQYLYTPFTGDGQIIARLLTLTPGATPDIAKAGVMFRDSLDAGAENAYMLQFPNPGSRPGYPAYQWRASTGGNSSDHLLQTNTPMPLWLRLVRTGSTFTGSWAMDVGGMPGTWNQLGAETVVMGPSIYVGLAVTAHHNGQTVTATFDNLQIIPAVEQTSHLDVSASPTFVNPGSPLTVTVKALDQFNNVDPGYRGTVHFTSSDTATGVVIPPDYPFTAADNGVHTFSVTLRTLGRQTVTVTDTASSFILGGTAVTVTNVTQPTNFLVAGFPTLTVAGTPHTFTVTARDAMNNTVPGYRGTVHFTSSDAAANLPPDYMFTAVDNGVHTFTATLNTVGTQSITATDLTIISVTGTQSGIQVVAAPAIASINHSAVINERGAIDLSGTIIDTTAGQTHAVVVGWGDGSANTTINLAAGVFTFITSHTYADEGSFAIKVTVTAANGGSDTMSLPVVPVAPASTGLVGWWTGNATGTTVPDSADSNPGTLNGGVSIVQGQVGNAFSFDGNPNHGSYINIPDAASLDSTTGTWAFWLKSTQTDGFVGLVGKSDSGSSANGITMQMDQGKARVEVKSGGATLLLNPTAPVLNDGLWHQMALAFQSGGTATLYIDGQVAATGTAPAFAFGANDPLRFGVMTDGFWTPYNGLLQQVQIYNRMLSAAEIQAIYTAPSVPAPPVAVSAPAGLVGMWTFDGNGPTAADLADGHPGTLSGNVTAAPGKVGTAFSFGGNGSFVNVPDAPSLDSTTGTWAFWLKTTQTNNFVGLVGKSDAGGSVNGITMQMDQGKPRVEVKSGNSTLLLNPSTPLLNDGQWHHMALTFQSGGAVTLYIDGRVAATGTAPTFSFGANDSLRFGTMSDGFWTSFNGQLDGVQIYNRVLSTGEIQAIINAAPVAPPANLVDWWTGDGNSPTTAPDIAGASPGTLNGGVIYAPGKVGNAFSFNGASSRANYVNIPDAPSLDSTAGTWDFWVKTTQSGSFVGFVGKADQVTSLNGLIMQMDPSGLPRLEIKNATQTALLTGSSHLNDGQWHNFALSFQSGGAMVMYVDGQVQATGTAPVFTFNPNPMRFGTQLDGFWVPYNGLLDEVQIYNRVLSGGEIQSIVGAGGAGLIKGVRVNDPAVLAAGGFNFTATAGVSTGLQTVATFTDPAGAEAVADYAATINWGDNTAPSAGTINLSSGVFTVQGSHTYTLAGPHTITVTIRHDAAADATATDTAQVSPAAASQLVVSGSPTSSGSIGTFIVTATDAFGNTATSYRGTVHIDSSAAVLLPDDYTFTAADNGSHSFGIVLSTVGPQTVTATDLNNPAISGTGAVTVTPRYFTLEGFPSEITAGVAGSFTVTAYDVSGNVADGYRGTVHFTSSDPQASPGNGLPSDYTFTAADAGVHTFTATLKTAGVQSITVTDPLTPDRSTGSQIGIQVHPAAAASLFVYGYPTTVAAGESHFVNVIAYDPFGNVASGYTGTVHLTTNDPQAFGDFDHTFTPDESGQATLSVTFITASPPLRSITATDTVSGTVAAGTQDGITVTPAAASQSVVTTAYPSPVTAGTANTITITIKDVYNNVVTGYTGTVIVSSSDEQMTPFAYSFVPATDHGVHTFNVTLKTAGTQSIFFDDLDAGIHSQQDGIEVTAAAVARFAVFGYPSGGSTFEFHTFTVMAIDAFGNQVTNYRGTVHLSSDDALLPEDYTFTADDAGMHVFTTAFQTAGTHYLRAVDTVFANLFGEEDGIEVI
jgi:hypothetical protein